MNVELTTLDILYLSLAGGFLVLVGFLAFLIVRVVKTLDSARELIEDVDDTAKDVRGLKNQIKGKAFGITGTLLGMVAGRRG